MNSYSKRLISFLPILLTLALAQSGLSQSGGAQLYFSQQSLSFPGEGGRIKVQVTANVNWAATIAPNWILLLPEQGVGSREMEIICLENTSENSRSARVTIGGGGLSASILVNQEGGTVTPCTAAAELQLNNIGYSFAAIAWEAVAGVEAYQSRLRTLGADNWQTSPWISQTNDVWNNLNPCQDYEIQIRTRCEEGQEGAFGSSLIFQTLGCDDVYCYSYGNSSDYWIEEVQFGDLVQRSGNGFGYSNFTNLFSEAPTGEQLSLKLTPGTNRSSSQRIYWRVWVDWNEDHDFKDDKEQVFQIQSTANTKIETTFQVPEDATPGDKRMRVSFNPFGFSSPCQNRVTMDVEDYTLRVVPYRQIITDPADLNFSAAGGALPLKVAADYSWTIETAAEWLSLSAAQGTGEQSVEVNCDPNPNFSPREGEISVYTADAERIVKVTQAGRVPQLQATPFFLSFAANGGQAVLEITSEVSWQVESSAAWLYSDVQSGAGGANLQITCSPNPDGQDRFANIVVRNAEFDVQAVVLVNQSAQFDVFNPEVNTLNFGYEANCQNLAIESNAAWEAVQIPDWLSVSPEFGFGDSSLEICVKDNPIGSERSEEILFNINGSSQATLVITQAGDQSGVSWRVSPTNENHTVILKDNIISNIRGEPLALGDRVGVFYERDGLSVCGGFTVWEGATTAFPAYGDDVDTPEKDGFTPGETFQVKVFQAATQTSVDATPAFAPTGAGRLATHTGQYAPDGVSVVERLRAVSDFEFRLPLHNGWNLVSSFVEPGVPAMPTIFEGIADQLAAVKNGAGEAFIPSLQLNDIGDWQITQGYKVKANNDTELMIEGPVVDPSNTPIILAPGWNLIAYLRSAPAPAADELSGILDDLEIVKDHAGRAFIPAFGIDEIGLLSPGQAYYVKAKRETTLFYSTNDLQPIEGELPKPGESQHFVLSDDYNTGQNSTLIIPTSSIGGRLEKGDELGVFSPAGVLCGAAVYENENLSLAIWGDDDTTPESEGVTTGASYELRLWNKAAKLETKALFTLREGDGFYETNDIEILESLQEPTTSTPIVEAEKRFSIYPNPFRQSFLIMALQPSMRSSLHIELINAEGRSMLKKSVSLEEWNSDSMEIHMAKALAAGFYNLRIIVGKEVYIYRLIKV